ncbi:hypothetical protein HNP46_004368 [Pseudomonas nitritireducens]|uniref:Uncharacterized protein n=1 Tax=Pseudomonas nitroreducens TaxID=46680 RepID=A0A7W7P353_PSENT|nr:hypothetical protein [Pseudomonas nitritireducens]MBB4865474.1 hypothetical protein [Pseudomonas nitritireducens]
MSSREPLALAARKLHEQLSTLTTTVGEIAEILEGRAHQPAMLTELKMAEYLGITQGALASRRKRKLFPEHLMVKFNRSWYYNVDAYEEWVLQLWESALAAKHIAKPPSPKRRTAPPGHGKPVYVLK